MRDSFDYHVALHDTDAFGVLFAGAPVGWSQIGIENLFRAAGHPVETLAAADVGYPVMSVQVDHFEPLRLGDAVRIETRIAETRSRSFLAETAVTRVADGTSAVSVRRVQVAIRRDGERASLEDWLVSLGPTPSPDG